MAWNKVHTKNWDLSTDKKIKVCDLSFNNYYVFYPSSCNHLPLYYFTSHISAILHLQRMDICAWFICSILIDCLGFINYQLCSNYVKQLILHDSIICPQFDFDIPHDNWEDAVTVIFPDINENRDDLICVWVCVFQVKIPVSISPFNWNDIPCIVMGWLKV